MAKEAKDRVGKTAEILCERCKVVTKHTIQGAYDTHWSDEESDVSGGAENDLLSCNGCDSVTYRCRSWFSEEDGWNVTLMPPRGGPATREPKDFDELPYGSPIESVYRQTITAYNSQLPTLTGAGVRLLIEGICKERGIKNGEVVKPTTKKKQRKNNLEGRINGMYEAGLISKNQADTLHEIRFLGNDAAHELDQPARDVQNTAINIVEHILDQVYEQPEQTKALKSRKRPKP
jgi:hypothetical protein